MPQRRSIAGAIREANQGPSVAPAVAPALPPQSIQPRPAPARTRQGKKMIAAPVDPAARKQLKALANEQDRTAEDLIREALRDLFVKYGKPAIA
jgi:hypothetical protein